MSEVFLLWHSHEIGDGETDDKLIGAYSSSAEAEAAIVRKRAFPGFRQYPDGFAISRYEVDKDAWSEGFGTG